MKRWFKFFFISLASFLLLFLIAVSILMWYVFTPEKLTHIIRYQSVKHIPYQTEIGEVEITVFSTFPQLGIKISNFAVISPGTGAPSDTLLKADQLIGVIDAKAFWKHSNLIVNKFKMNNGSLNIFVDSLGQSNYGLLMAESLTETDQSTDMAFSYVNLKNIELTNFNISYIDFAAKLNTSITNLSAKLSGTIREDIIKSYLNLDNANVSFEYDGEIYLDNTRVRGNIPSEIIISRQLVQLKEAYAAFNDLGATVNGSIEYDTINKNIFADISYQLNSWQINDAIVFIPSSYLSDFGVIDAYGVISSRGNIKGSVNDSLLPFMDIHISLTEGNLQYDELPFPLSEISGEIIFYSDFNNNPSSYIHINHFETKTPKSEFKTRGKVSHLFSDIHYDLITDANVQVDEFQSFIPEDMNLSINGRISGQVKTDFYMSQATDIALDKMKLSGSVLLSGFSLVYDSISMSTNHSKVDFSLPNHNPEGRNTKFAFAKIESDNLIAARLDDFSTSMKNNHIYIEMSDIRDLTEIPDLFCTFSIDSFYAGMDTISISVGKHYGNFSISPVSGVPSQPFIQLAYNGVGMTAHMGSDSANIDHIAINTDIINDKSQEDVFLQWLAKGFLEINNGTIYVSSLSYPVEIPAIKMNFDHETFNISESEIKIDQSDFGLTGVLSNVLSYFRGDSILLGEFNFISNTTDLAQLMYLTSGIGVEEEAVNQNPSQPNNNSSFSGPYMVPQGIELFLRANVKQAVMDLDTVTDIIGDVRVNDGILLLDGLTFTTPAADMQLTAMYRTPRKNHLYLGLDYHMLDVEISRLLQMIPDIDTLMPMLRSFEGSGEFHIAIETYLDSLYNIKKSTLRGASSIRGKDLVLMDGETFSEIAKTLRFSRGAENRVDSLSAEFTIFREEIDIYPFLIVMDRYKAVVGGRHNFDMSFDYHISLVESPLPIRLGIDITGTMEQLRYRLASPRYAEFYRPVSRRAVESRQLELRKMIREALLRNVRN